MTTLSREQIDAFVASIKESGRSQATATAYRSDLVIFADWAQTSGADSISSAASAWLNSGRAELAPKTTRRRFTSIRTFMKWADVDQGALADYSLPTPKKTKPHPLIGGMDSVRLLLAAAKNSAQRTLIVLQGFGGMRVAEALSVRVSDIDRKNGIITVRGKGDKEREVPFDPTSSAFQIIRERSYEVNSGLLVRMSDRTAREAIGNIADRAGVSAYTKDRVSSHDLRATAATALYVASGHNIRLVQEFLGHASVAQTEIYVGTSRDQFSSAVAAL